MRSLSAGAITMQSGGLTALAVRLRGRWPELVLVGVAGAYVAAFVGTGLLRAVYPYPVDGVEPGALQEVQRVLKGQPLYVKPELGYVPLIYGPVYFYVSAAFSALARSALLGMRLVSVLASVGSITFLMLLVRRETGSLAMGLVSGGLFAACGPLVDMAMDIGRMDALALCLMLGGVYFARIATSWRGAAGAGLLMGLSLLTKQSGVPVVIAMGIALVLLRRAQVVPYAAAAVLTVALGVLVLVAQAGTWPLFYLWELPRRHELEPQYVSRLWSDLLMRFAIPMVVGPFYLYARAKTRDRERLTFYVCACLGLIATAWISDSNIGGGRNVQLPAYAAFALLFGLALHEALSYLTGTAERVRVGRTYVMFAAVAQFAMMLYNPRLVVPYRSDMWDGERLSATVASLQGPVFAGSYRGYVGEDVIAPDLGAVRELEGAFGGTGTQEGSDWEGLLAHALSQRQLAYVIVDPDNEASIVPILAKDFHYQDAGPLFPPGDIYWAWRTGWAPKAEVYVPPT
ncbi:MAG: glycosyltransferase family 39 protein [Chloroflexi bacterium]|nr:glycosyltransferase family 39 protein [Chloroflexota bacterium]